MRLLVCLLFVCGQSLSAVDDWQPREHLNAQAYAQAIDALPEIDIQRKKVPYGFQIYKFAPDSAGKKAGFLIGDCLYAIANEMFIVSGTHTKYLQQTRAFSVVTKTGEFAERILPPGKAGCWWRRFYHPEIFYCEIWKDEISGNNPWEDCARALSHNLQLAETALAKCEQHNDARKLADLTNLLTFLYLEKSGSHDEQCLRIIEKIESDLEKGIKLNKIGNN